MLALDPRTTALVLIDVQKGVLSMPLAPHGAAQVVQNAARLGLHFDEVGALVVLVHVAFSGAAVDRLSQPVDAASPAPTGSLPADWAEFAPEIAALRAGVVITKRQWGAFYGTELDLQLRRRGVATIVLAGVATNFGVEFDGARGVAAQLRGGRRRRRGHQPRRGPAPVLDRQDPAAHRARALDRRNRRRVADEGVKTSAPTLAFDRTATPLARVNSRSRRACRRRRRLRRR